MARMEYANIRETHTFAAQHNIDCESRPCDTVDIIYSTTEWHSALKTMAEMKTFAPNELTSRYEIIDAETAKREFHVDGDVKGAVRFEAGSIHAYKFTTFVRPTLLCLHSPSIR